MTPNGSGYTHEVFTEIFHGRMVHTGACLLCPAIAVATEREDAVTRIELHVFSEHGLEPKAQP